MAYSSDAVIDTEHLMSFTAGDKDLEAEFAALFIETAQLHLVRLREAADDAVAWQRTAHALKGASANIGALVVAKLAAEQEQRAPDIGALHRLEREIQAVRQAFEARGALPAL